MPTPAPRDLRLGLIEPKDAVAYFERKNLLLPSFRWHDVYAEEHAAGVAVAGVMKTDVLQAFADELAATQRAGGSLRTFQANMEAVLQKKGMWGDNIIYHPTTGERRITTFDKSRLQLIFDVNTRQAFAAGRWQRIEANKARKPFLMYRTMRDERVRHSHRLWDGLVLPVESVFWRQHYPPNGWRCRCKAFAVSEKDIARYIAAGWPINRDLPDLQYVEYVNQSTGEVRKVAAGVDPGFDYNPGLRRFAGVSSRELDAGVLAPPANTELPATTRLPPPRPVAANMLMPTGLSESEYLAAFLAEFDDAPEFTDVTGTQLLITDELFKTIDGRSKVQKRGREQFVRLLALTIRAPDEIWMTRMQHIAKGKEVLRRRYIARFQVEGQDTPVLGVFEEGADGWRGVTGYQAQTDKEAADMLSSVREGVQVYGRVNK